MILANIVLEKLSEAKPIAGRHELACTDETSGWTLYLVADRHDEMSVLIWELALRRPENDGDLAAWAKRLAENCTSIDALKVIEIDSPRNQALLRSATPTARQDKLFYYEIVLQ